MYLPIPHTFNVGFVQTKKKNKKKKKTIRRWQQWIQKRELFVIGGGVQISMGLY